MKTYSPNSVEKSAEKIPEEFRFFIEEGLVSRLQSLALALSVYRHPNAKKMLKELAQHPDVQVRQFSEESVAELK